MVRIRVSDLDVLRVQGQLLGENLHRDGLRAVAPERRVQGDKGLAGRVDLERNRIGRAGPFAARLQIPHPELGGAEHAALLAGGDADADIAALLAQLLLLGAPAIVFRQFQGFVEHGGIIAAVIHIAGRDQIGELIGLDKIHAPDVDRIHAELRRRAVDQAFDDEIGDLGAEAAIGALLAFVGEHRFKFDLDRVDGIGADALREGIAMLADAELKIGAVIVDDVGPEAEERAIVFYRQLGVIDPVGAVRVAAGGVVDTVFHEFDRPADCARQRRRQNAGLMAEQLGAETAAGECRHDIQFMGVDAERTGDHPAAIIIHRGIGMDGELAGAGIVTRHRAVGFHRRAAGARPAEAALDHPVGLGEIFLHRAEGQGAGERDIGVAAIGMKDGVARRSQRFLEIDHRRQRLILDLDQIAGILGDIARFGGDRDDRFADMAHLVLRDAMLVHRRVGPARQRAGDLRRLGAGHDAQHAGQRFRLALIDTDDFRMGMRAAQNGGMGHVRKICVVGENAAADQQPRVLDPLHALADIVIRVARLFGLPAFRNKGVQTHLPAPRMVAAADSMASMMV